MGTPLPEVTAAVAARAGTGAATMLPTEDASWVAGELAARFGLPLWQFTVSATDANRIALRLARHVTGRRRVAVFDWCYHGTVDEALVTLDAAGRVVPRAGSLGPAADPATTSAVVPFNDADALAATLAAGDIACVLAEPALTNIGIVLPEPGFLDAVRELTRRAGALLVLDETHTVCAGPGGCTAAWGLDPDVLVIGKAIGGGLPAGAYGLSAELGGRLRADLTAPSVDVSGIGGTLAGNALSVAAMRAALTSTLRAEDFAVTVPLAERFTDGVAGEIAATRTGLARAASRLSGRVLVRPAATRRRRGGRRRRRRAGGVHAPLRPQPWHPAHTIPQHGAVHSAAHGGRRRSAHRGVRECAGEDRDGAMTLSHSAPTVSGRTARRWRSASTSAARA